MQESKIDLDLVHDMCTSDPLSNVANHEDNNLRGFYVSYDCFKQTSDNVVTLLKAAFGKDNVVEVGRDNDQSRLSLDNTITIIIHC